MTYSDKFVGIPKNARLGLCGARHNISDYNGYDDSDTDSFDAEYWLGPGHEGDKVLDVALIQNDYPLKFTNLLECYENACLQHPDCVGVSFEYHGYRNRLCYVWQSCDFDNLIIPDEDPKSWSLKRGSHR